MPKTKPRAVRHAIERGALDRRLGPADKPLNGVTSNRVIDDPDAEAMFRHDPDSGKLIVAEVDPATLRPAPVKAIVTASLRHDPLARLHKRSHISDAEYAAGDWLRAQFELLNRAALRGVDISKPFVDGSAAGRAPLTGAQQRAGKHTLRAYRTLGSEGFRLVYAVLGERKYIEQVAEHYALDRGTPATKRDVLYLGRRFRECLNTMSFTFGFATRAPHGKTPRDAHREQADSLANAALRRAMVLAGADVPKPEYRRIDAPPLRLDGVEIKQQTTELA